jgi:hypothetical protein
MLIFGAGTSILTAMGYATHIVRLPSLSILRLALLF